MPSIVIDGVERFLGNNPAPLRYNWREYGSVPEAPMVDKDKWKGMIDAIGAGPEVPNMLPVHDQDGIGMCNASATALAIEQIRADAGLPYIPLSGGDLYQRISGGTDRGSFLEDGLAESMSRGIASVAVVPYLDWRGENPGAAEDRANYRVLEAWICPTFAHCMSAVLMGFKLISGVMWYNNYTPDAKGWLPLRGSGGGGGHAVCGYKPTYHGSTYGIWHQNSWRESWGLGGRCVFPETMYGAGVGGWWAVRVAVDDGTNLPPLKP